MTNENKPNTLEVTLEAPTVPNYVYVNGPFVGGEKMKVHVSDLTKEQKDWLGKQFRDKLDDVEKVKTPTYRGFPDVDNVESFDEK